MLKTCPNKKILLCYQEHGRGEANQAFLSKEVQSLRAAVLNPTQQASASGIQRRASSAALKPQKALYGKTAGYLPVTVVILVVIYEFTQRGFVPVQNSPLKFPELTASKPLSLSIQYTAHVNKQLIFDIRTKEERWEDCVNS